MRYRGRAAIVTGGAAGIGLAIARRLVAEGARVAVWDQSGAAEAARRLGAAHVGCAVDVSDEAGVAQATDATWRAFGHVDLLVNNAGILGPVAPLWEQAPGDFRRVVDVNLIGTYLVCRAVVPRLRQQSGPNRGRIVNISSIQAKEGLAMSSAYAASKAGIIALDQDARQGTGGRGHSRQLHHARRGGDGHDGSDRRAAPRRHPVPYPDEPLRRAR